jgi:hypothetical protein
MTEAPSHGDRVARNEALFRQVNERVREVSEAFATLDPSSVDFVCECGNEDCADPVTLNLSQYEEVRAEPTWFFVVPGHVKPKIERVVLERDGYLVVEKLPDEDQIARETDPRS